MTVRANWLQRTSRFEKEQIEDYHDLCVHLIGMLFGGLAGAGFEAGPLGIVIGIAIGGCLWTFFKNFMIRLWNGWKGGGFNIISFVIALVVGFVIEAVSSIIPNNSQNHRVHCIFETYFRLHQRR